MPVSAKLITKPRRQKAVAAAPAAKSRVSARAAKSGQVLAILRNFRVVFKSAQKHSRWIESQCGVTDPQLWILGELSSQPGLRVMDLANIMSLHQSTVSNLLDKLEKKTLIRRERCAGDQRVVRVYLTGEGKQALDRAPKPAMSLLPDALYKLPDEVLRMLGTATAELVSVLGMKDEEAALEPINRA